MAGGRQLQAVMFDSNVKFLTYRGRGKSYRYIITLVYYYTTIITSTSPTKIANYVVVLSYYYTAIPL